MKGAKTFGSKMSGAGLVMLYGSDPVPEVVGANDRVMASAVDAILKTLLGPNESTAARPEEARMAAYKARKSKVTHKSSLTTGGASGAAKTEER